MGYLEVLDTKNKLMTIYGDDEVRLVKIEHCDFCEQWKELSAGTFWRDDMWECGDCNEVRRSKA